jgi:hypothetical protein
LHVVLYCVENHSTGSAILDLIIHKLVELGLNIRIISTSHIFSLKEQSRLVKSPSFRCVCVLILFLNPAERCKI